MFCCTIGYDILECYEGQMPPIFVSIYFGHLRRGSPMCSQKLCHGPNISFFVVLKTFSFCRTWRSSSKKNVFQYSYLFRCEKGERVKNYSSYAVVAVINSEYNIFALPTSSWETCDKGPDSILQTCGIGIHAGTTF